MKNRDIVELFQFVVQEVERLRNRRVTDCSTAAYDGLYRLPLTYDPFPRNHYECGKMAAQKLYEMAEIKLQELPELRDRIKVETFLKPIKVELAQRALAKRTKVDEALVKGILQEATARAKAVLEDRIYFFPVYTVDEEGVDEFRFGPATFIRTHKFFADNNTDLKRSEELAVTHGHFPKLFDFAREHYGSYRWVARIEIKGAEPDVAWDKARDVLEQSLGLLRLSWSSQRGTFIGVIEDYPLVRSASYLSQNRAGEFKPSHFSSYAEPGVMPGSLKGYREKLPQIGNVEGLILKVQKWEQPDVIENRLLTALFWFNEAWKETRALIKIVKFATCVESLFLTGHDTISETISERLAWLSYPGIDHWKERSETYRTMKMVYAARSKAVHGDSAAKGLDLQTIAGQAEEAAGLGIFAFAQLPPLFHGYQDKGKALNDFFVQLKLEGHARTIQTFREKYAPTME